MLQMLRKRLNKDEEGFTLIELMVVVLIIAILLAIAIPTFLGARTRAQHRAAQSNLRNALTAEKTAYTDSQSYVANTAVQSIEPSLSFANGAPNKGDNSVQVTPNGGTNNGVCIIDEAADGTFYGIEDVASADASGGFQSVGTFYAKGTTTTAPTCPSASSGGVITTPATGWYATSTLASW